MGFCSILIMVLNLSQRINKISQRVLFLQQDMFCIHCLNSKLILWLCVYAEISPKIAGPVKIQVSWSHGRSSHDLPIPRDHADNVHQDWTLCECWYLALLTLLVEPDWLYSLTQEDSTLETPELVSTFRYPEGCHCPAFFGLLPATKESPSHLGMFESL